MSALATQPTANKRIGTRQALGLALIAVIPAALVFAALAPQKLVHALGEGGIACPFLAITGFVCPFCGMTRATLAAGSGDLTAAFAHHLLFPAVWLLWWAGAWQLVRTTRQRWFTPQLVLAAVGVMWIANLVHHHG